MNDCPDHSEDESPWMCECTRRTLTELRARLEALAEKWTCPDTHNCDYNYRAGLRQAGIELRALLAPPAPGSAPARTLDEMLHALGCSRCGKNFAACQCAAPVAEPPPCEECAACEEGDRGYWFCELSGDLIFTERKDGVCGPTGRLFKRRVG